MLIGWWLLQDMVAWEQSMWGLFKAKSREDMVTMSEWLTSLVAKADEARLHSHYAIASAS